MPSSSVILPYFNRTVPLRKRSREHFCMCSTFSIAILNGPCFICSLGIDFVLDVEYHKTKYYFNNNKSIKYSLQNTYYTHRSVSSPISYSSGGSGCIIGVGLG